MDTVAEGRLTTGGVDIGAAITALTAQSYAGWYISGSGANGHCDKACQDVGLICTETEFAKHIHEVDECAEVGAIVLSHYKGRGGGGEAECASASGAVCGAVAGCERARTRAGAPGTSAPRPAPPPDADGARKA